MFTLELTGVTTKERTAEIMTILEQGVRDVFESDRYLAFLRVQSRFHFYSFRNAILISLQMPTAEKIAGIGVWNRMGHQVIKGSRAIRILAPATIQQEIWEDAKNVNGQPIVNPDTGKPVQILRKREVRIFKPVSVFDVSQTTGDSLPELATELQGGDLDGSDRMLEAIRQISPCPIFLRSIKGKVKGYFDPIKQEIVVKSGMSHVQTLKTLLHEIFHSRNHNPKNQQSSVNLPKDRRIMEIEAESAAYVIMNWFGIDSASYSFEYLAAWSSSAELKELQQSLATIQHESNQIIEEIQKALQPLPFGFPGDEKVGDDLAS